MFATSSIACYRINTASSFFFQFLIFFVLFKKVEDVFSFFFSFVYFLCGTRNCSLPIVIWGGVRVFLLRNVCGTALSSSSPSHMSTTVFAIYQPNYVGWENVYLVNIFMKRSNSPTQGQTNPRRLWVKSGNWATVLTHSKIFFRGLGLVSDRKQTRNLIQPNSSQTP